MSHVGVISYTVAAASFIIRLIGKLKDNRMLFDRMHRSAYELRSHNHRLFYFNQDSVNFVVN